MLLHRIALFAVVEDAVAEVGAKRLSVMPSGHWALGALVTLVIFAVDVSLPLGVAGGVPYIVVVLLAYRLPSRWASISIATITSLLVLAGYFLSPDGGVPWMVLTNRGLALLVIWIGATLVGRAQRTAQALWESEKSYSDFVEGTDDLVTRVDADGRFTFVNAQADRLFGLAPSACIGLSAFDFVHPEDRQATIDAFDSWARDGLSSTTFENRQLSRSGRTSHVLWTINLHRDEFGQLSHINSIARDITARRLAEEERQSLETQLQHAQKLESLGVLAGGIAHDFNNLLTGILGNADLAYADLPTHSPARPCVDAIMKASRQAAALTNQMLAYSGRGRFVNEEIDLNALVRDMNSLLDASISKNTRLKYEFADDLPTIMADASQLRQIVINLVTNASDAIGEENGLVTVRTITTECDRAFLDQVQVDEKLPEGRYVSFEVSDTGCGMDEATKGKMFDPFFTTKSSGRGLGLAALHGIVRGHKGGIAVESEVGVGTTFKISFPALAHRADSAQAISNHASDWQGRGTVLVVDDVEMVRDFATEILKRLGLGVLTASDGTEAVELFRDRHAEIDCVLLDLKMPNMCGEEAFGELRKIRDDIPVILSSGYSEEESTRQFEGQGLAGFLQKPYTLANLREKLSELLGAAN